MWQQVCPGDDEDGDNDDDDDGDNTKPLLNPSQLSTRFMRVILSLQQTCCDFPDKETETKRQLTVASNFHDTNVNIAFLLVGFSSVLLLGDVSP